MANRSQWARRVVACVVLLLAGQASGQTKPSNAETFKDLYDHIAKVYPCFEMKQIDWKKVGEELIPESEKPMSDEQFGLLCMRLIARLQDSHAMLLKGTKTAPVPPLPLYDPGFACLIDDRGKPVVYCVEPSSPAEAAGIRVGMTITAVRGMIAEKAIEQWMARTSNYYGYSSQRYLLYDAALGFMRTDQGGLSKIEAEDLDGTPLDIVLHSSMSPRYMRRLPVPIEGIADSASIGFTMLDGGIGYIYVRRIDQELTNGLDRAVESLTPKISKGLILDVRGNSGGGFDSSIAFGNFELEEKSGRPAPLRYTGPIALLLDERCISAGEGWASWFIAKKRARTFGTATAGASSRKEDYPLLNKQYIARIPVKAYTGFLDRPIESKGLEPDVPVRCTARDLAQGRDTVLETARTWLLDHAKNATTQP